MNDTDTDDTASGVDPLAHRRRGWLSGLPRATDADREEVERQRAEKAARAAGDAHGSEWARMGTRKRPRTRGRGAG